MRKRSQRKTKSIIEKPKHKIQKKPKPVKKKFSFKKEGWVALSLIGIFFVVLFFNSFFNIASDVAVNPDGEGLEKYYLSGPDPYYNMRLVKVTHETGKYPFYSENDPLLNYPTGATGGRAPLFNMMSLGFSRLLTPFMDEVDAIGRSMQFIPALFGALIIFPVYFIGKTVFNKKAGLIAAFFLAIIPVHIGSGHGSAYSLFDHDSFNLLLFFLTFLFLILGIKEKNAKKSMLYAVLGGVSLAAVSMTWVKAEFMYAVVGVYAIVQMLFDIFLNKIDLRVFRTSSILLLTGFFVSLPVIFAKSGSFPFRTSFAVCVVVTAFGFVYYLFGKKRVPWTLSLPAVFGLGVFGLGVLYAVHIGLIKMKILSSLSNLANIVFGTGIYGKKVSMTIAEASTYQISNTVMSFGPALYWVGWAGFFALLYFYYKDKMRRDYLFILSLFVIDLWLTSTAGRFINDMVPVIAILAGGITWFVIKKIDYKQMIRNIRNAGGGIHGIRRGVKLLHIFGILFIAFVVILPNVFLALDAAVPSKVYQEEDGNWTNLKWEVFGEGHASAFGLSINKEVYWVDAFEWLSDQDVYDKNNDTLDDTEKPAFISWWDYGFYEVATGEHPTVADNFQDGIPPAGNFHTATCEKEAVAVWIVRLLEGIKKDNDYKIPENVKDIFKKYVDNDTAENMTLWIENPEKSPSYNEPIDEQYHKYLEDVNTRNLQVGSQWPKNAVYHDMVDILVNNNKTALTDDQITWFYHDIQEASNYSIRYYGVEGYDRQIFNIFAFLSDKSIVMLRSSKNPYVQPPQDKFVSITFSGQKYREDGTIEKTYTNEPLETYLEMSDKERRYIQITNENQNFKDPYFDTMFYKTYIGPYDIDQNTGEKKRWNDLQYPCIDMKHFYAEYISDISDPFLQYQNSGQAAVVIAKYYEGAYVNGSVWFNGDPINKNITISVRKNLQYAPKVTLPIDHDKMKIYKGTDGKFNLIAGADSSVVLLKNLELSNYQPGAFVVKKIDFDNTSEGSDMAPITDDDAMRKKNSNYERKLNISIDPSFVNGFVYNDTDDDGKYNSSVDKPLEDAQVIFYEINKFDENRLQNDQMFPTEGGYEFTANAQTNSTGYYKTSAMLPGWYLINVYHDDYLIAQDIKPFYSGNTSTNYTMPELSSVEGTVYHDTNQDGKYDPFEDEEITDAQVDLYYQKLQGEKSIGSFTTDENGHYSFTNLVLGSYNIDVTSEYYQTEKTFSIKENETKVFNVSAKFKPVELSGNALYNEEGVEGVSIQFNINKSVDLNTAQHNSATTDSEGKYSVELQPGSYNITLSKSISQGYADTIVYASDQYNLVLTKEQKNVTKEFNVLKKTVTVSGDVTYDGEKQENVTIEINPVDTNLTIDDVTVLSDQDGRYSAEIIPLSNKTVEYNITASVSNLTGNDYDYSWTGYITISESYIETGVTKNIVLVRKE